MHHEMRLAYEEAVIIVEVLNYAGMDEVILSSIDGTEQCSRESCTYRRLI